MKVSYLHGLESPNHGPKVDWLNENFKVYAPRIDYNNDGVFDKVLKGCKGSDLIIGSSMGGYFAYLIGMHLNIPTVIFNPAVVGRKFDPAIIEPKGGGTKNIVILGDNDKVINGSDIKKYFKSEGNGVFKYESYKGGHRVPENVFIESISKALKLGESTEIYKTNKTNKTMGNNNFNKMKTFESFMNEDNSEEVVSTEDKYKVADKLNECYNEAVNEAKEWAEDVHDDHTEESYMKENAALVAALAANALKESKDHTPEQFEASINVMKEAFSKKLNEILEMENEGEVEEE
jgi:hypothetical protein